MQEAGYNVIKIAREDVCQVVRASDGQVVIKSFSDGNVYPVHLKFCPESVEHDKCQVRHMNKTKWAALSAMAMYVDFVDPDVIVDDSVNPFMGAEPNGIQFGTEGAQIRVALISNA